MRKQRSDSRLGSLPPEKQEALYERLSGLSLADAVAHLARTEDIQTSKSALSEWLAFHRVRAAGERYRKLQTAIADLAKNNTPAPLADAAIGNAIREYAISQLAREDVSPTDARNLAAMVHGTQRLAFDAAKLAASEKLSATRERQHARAIDLAERRVKLLETNAAEARDRLAKTLETARGGLTAETVANLEQAIKLL